MKLLSVLLSLLLGLAVLAVFLQPWEWASPSRRPAPPHASASPSSTPEQAPPSTAAIEQPSPPGPPPAADAGRAQSKTHLLAREQVEAERQAALVAGNHPVQPAPATKRYFKVKVRDAGTLETDAAADKPIVIRIEGIKAREADGLCTRADGSNWPCGAQARAALTRFIRARAVTCALPPGGETAEFSARCSVMEQDLAAWLVRQGWALPAQQGEPALAAAMEAARSGGLGLWRNGEGSP